MNRRLLAALAPALAVALASCSHPSSTGSSRAATTTAAPAEVLVAFGSTSGWGGGLTDRLRDSWPQLLFRGSFPLPTVFFNLSDDPLSIGRAVALQLPVALEQHATIAAIWLGPDEQGPCTAETTATSYAPALTSLVKPLRDSGARVFVGNVPDGVPCAVAFNAAVTNVARAQGATVADVASALASTPAVGPGSRVTLPESRAVAAAFAAVAAGS